MRDARPRRRPPGPLERRLAVEKAGIDAAGTEVMQVDVDHPVAAPGLPRREAQIRAVQVKARQIRRRRNARPALQHAKILVEAVHQAGKGAARLVGAMRVRDADHQASFRRGPRMAGDGPGRVMRLQRRQPVVQHRGAVADQAHILVAADDEAAACAADHRRQAREGAPAIGLAVVEVEELRLPEAMRDEAGLHGLPLGVVGNQGADGEFGRRGLAGGIRQGGDAVHGGVLVQGRRQGGKR